MSLSELVGGPDSTTIPGHTLSPPRLMEFSEAEDAAAKSYIELVNSASRQVDDDMRLAMHQRAVETLQLSPFSFGSGRFCLWAMSSRGVKFLGWLSLRILSPGLAYQKAVEIIAAHPGCENAILKLWGVMPDQKKAASGERSIGAKSSGISQDPPPVAVQ